MVDLKGKNVVYVGGYGGIGYACCKALVAKDIHCLAIVDVKQQEQLQQELEQLNSKVKVKFFALNLLDGKEAIESVLKDVVAFLGVIDVLVNGSGIADERYPRKIIDINLTGLVETTLLCIPLMSKENGGRGGLVVNIASVLGIEPCPTLCVYSASKHGVVGFTRSLAEPLYYEKTGIKYIAICPGFTDTPILNDLREDYTFEYAKPIVDALLTVKKQTAEECAANILKAIESTENGSVWLCDLGKLHKLDMKKYWEVTF